jgi:preprotein translocase subunit SecA
MTWMNWIKAVVGLPWQRRLSWAALQITRIRRYEREYSRLTDAEVTAVARRQRGRARGGESLDRLLPEAFGLASVACMRKLKMRPFDVQLAAGAVLHLSGLTELATGEGKTLVAIFPVYLNALIGKGVHVVTVNDYLARRDGTGMRPVYEMLGLTTGVLQGDMGDQDRCKQYRCDITYGTGGDYGFDFLRDRLKVAGLKGQESPFWAPWVKDHRPPPSENKVQRDELQFALVDEADSIFVDAAKTPLIINAGTRLATEEERRVFIWADKLAQQMTWNEHFEWDQKKQKLELLESGLQLIRWSNPPRGTYSHAMDKLIEHVEQALMAHHRYHRDVQYMLEDGKVILIDEGSGRKQPNVHWRDGLHQAVEAKESMPITKPSDHAAQITFQKYFDLYEKLAGMTGTAAQNWWELWRVYGLWVVCVPTNMPCRREALPDRVFPNEDDKFDVVVAEAQRMIAEGRAILIGTRSVEKSEKLSARLTAAGIEHQVLNAKLHEKEAAIIAEAGKKGRVTVATNMAGRGTDIQPDPDVLAAGGLHVLGTERHESRRIDRQLEGRAGRQGDPGSCQFFLCLEDELLEALGERKRDRLRDRGRRGGSGNWNGYHGYFLKAQRIVERRHYTARVDLLVRQKQRDEILEDLAADPYVD